MTLGLNDRRGNDWKKGRGARTCLRKNLLEEERDGFRFRE